MERGARQRAVGKQNGMMLIEIKNERRRTASSKKLWAPKGGNIEQIVESLRPTLKPPFSPLPAKVTLS